MSVETANKRRKGKGLITPEDGIKTRFNSENQPDSELKKIGWSKKRALKDLLGLRPGKINSQVNYVEACSNFFSIKPEAVTVKMIMDFRQAEKAILKGDTTAYVAVNDRAFGKPAQTIDIDANILMNDATVMIGKKPVSKE